MAYTPLSLTCNGKYSAKNRDPAIVNVWTYKTEDAMTSVRAADYISDALHRGMKAGDIVYVITMSAGAPSTVYVTSAVTVDGDGADLADGTALTLTNT